MNFKADAEAAMEGHIEKLSAQLGGVRTGRANPRLLDKIKVEYYGSMAPIKQVANVGVVEGRTLELRPFDPTALEAIDKALQKSDLGVPPQNDGKVIRVTFPKMTEERRKDVVKQVGKIGEEYRISIRGARQEAMQAIKKQAKDDNLPEDQVKGLEGGIQTLTDKYIEMVDAAVAAKQEEVSSI